jgi:hypothetical protein
MIMIVRISGTGQFELDEEACKRLDQLDTELTDALHQGDEQRFHGSLHEMIQFVQSSGSPVPHDRVVPSEVIVPPEDVTLDEAKRFFTDEGLMEPLPA